MKRTCGMPNKKCGGEFNTPMPENGSLEDLVSWWIAQKRPFFKEMLAFFGDGSLETAIKLASADDRPDDKKQYYSHQNCVSKEALAKWRKLLLGRKAEIAECGNKSFEDLLGLLESFKPKGIGALTCYDTALRLGAKLGCLPKKFVYLHAGAQLPGGKRYSKNTPKRVSDFPPTVKQRLKAYEIEDFLCVCQKGLKGTMFGGELRQ